MDINQTLQTEPALRTVPDRLRWTSDFLDLANNAICIIACAQGLEYPPDLYQATQRDLRAWAWYLDEHPSIAADFELACVAKGRRGVQCAELQST
jgi:hypothetical protein